MQKARQLWLLGLLIIVMPVMLKAGVTGKISGKITDQESGETIAGANIVIDGSYLGASSDLDGFYFIINIPPGTYDLTISVIGYSVQRIKGVKVITDQTTTINAELILTFLKGEEVTVFAERPTIEVDRTFSTSTVDNSEIEVMPITKMQEVIDIQAGVVDGHFRGGRKGEVAYLVDGISIQDSYEGVQSTEVNNSVVQELQVISGTFNAEYGQAMSGIVNMVTKEGALNYSGNLSVEYGDYISSHEDIFLGIDDISPMDDFSLNDGMPVMNDPQEANIANYEASLSGPLPFLNNISFFVNGRKERNNGWMNGENRWALEHPIIDTESGPELLLQEGDGEIVPMNPDDNIYLYGKLSSQLTPKIKLMYSSLWSDREYKDYDHYYKYIPGADYQRFKSSRTNLLKMVHSLNNSMFYDVAVSNTFTEYHHYVFEDPFDPQYVNPVYSDVNPPYTLNIGGVKTEHFRRYTDTHTLQGNFTWQANSVHLFKAGFKVDVHNLYFRSYNVIHDQYVSIMPDTVAPLVYAPYIPDVTDINHDYYLYHPYEAAIYLQDKIELESLIVNWGLRFDYFYPDGKIITDPMDPDINNPVFEEHLNDPLSVRETYWYDKPDPKMQVSPRIGIGYPISANGVLHFAYGHFFQRPKFEYMYTNPEFELEQGSGLNTVMGNADLAVERTVTYEFGLQQALSEYFSLDVNLFSRDIRDLVSTDLIVNTYQSGTQYSQYVNRDFGSIRGVTLALNKRYHNNVSGSLDYTFQVAEGNASDPQDAYNASKGDVEPLKQVVPLDWDRRHTLNLNINYTVPGDWGVSIIGSLGSGLPYTTEEQNVQLTVENDGRKPMYRNLDLSAYKEFHPGNDPRRRITFTVLVKNLFDTLNENDVYRDTGRATYTDEPNISLENAEINTFEEFYTQPQYYSRPREVRVGVQFHF